MERAQSIIEEARQRLQQLLEEYQVVEAELRRLENTEFRVCIFGSARISERHPTYKEVHRLARALASLGVDIVTGGGPGLMEAANRGVRDARNGQSKSYGLPIDIPSLAEMPNKHLDIKSQHKRFSSRLDEFIRLTHAVIVAPGGIGTLLELMYVWQLLQVGMMERRPVILLGRQFWQGFLEWVREQMLANGYIGAHDLDWIQLVDSPKEAVAVVKLELERFRRRQAAVREEGTVPDGGREATPGPVADWSAPTAPSAATQLGGDGTSRPSRRARSSALRAVVPPLSSSPASHPAP